MAQTIANANQLDNKVFTQDNLNIGEGLRLTTTKEHTDYSIIGSINIVDGVASGFSDTNYATCNNYLNSADQSFELCTAVKMNTASTTNLGIFDTYGATTHNIRLSTSSTNTAHLRISTDGGENYAVDITGTSPLTVGTKMYIKATYNSSTGYALYTSTDGSTWTTEGTSSVTTRPYSNAYPTIMIGDNAATGSSLTGSIYLSDSYINVNGSRVWTAYYLEEYNELSAPGAYNQNNLFAGDNVSITQLPTPFIDANTVQLLHLDGDTKDAISGINVYSGTSTLTYESSMPSFDKALHAPGTSDTGGLNVTPVTTFSKSQNFTIDFWVKQTSSSSMAVTGLDLVNYQYKNYTKLAIIGNTTLHLGSYPGASSAKNITIDSVLNQWVHIALVNSASGTAQQYLFLNGNLVGNWAPGSSSYAIGVYRIYGDGVVDEIRVSNVARWTSNFTPFSQPYSNGGMPQYAINTDLTSVVGYDSSKTQVLKHVNGTLTWVDEA